MAERFGLSRPVSDRFPITQRFKENPDAYRSTYGHTGIDFDTPEGTEVHAAARGTVSEAGLHNRSQKEPDKGYGWYVRIQHIDGFNTLYTQLRPQGVLVKQGDEVSRGQLIGYSGNSGQPGERPRLHFELRTGPSVSTAVDPVPYLETDPASPDYMPFSEANPNLESSFVSEASSVAGDVQQSAPDYSQGLTPAVSEPTPQEAASSVEPPPSEPNPPVTEASNVADQVQQRVTEPSEANAPGTASIPTTEQPQQAAVGPQPAGPPSTFVIPTNAVEYLRGNTLVRVAQTDQPWWMAVDAFVIPAGVPYGSLGGNFVSDWFQAIGPAHANSIHELVAKAALQPGGVTILEPDAELGKAILPFGGDRPRRIYLASAAGSDGLVRLSNVTGLIQQVVALARIHNVNRLGIPLVGAGGGGLNPMRVGNAMLTVLMGEIELDPIQEVTIVTLLPEVVDAARQRLNLYRNNLSQALSTDEASSRDTLGIEPQVNALAETLMLREMPGGIAVGILGSWGSGKTSVMKMIENRIRSILREPHGKGWEANPGSGQVSPYVGHFYPIWFNAWTYAKGNLWASLMDTIFVSLDDQLREDATRKEKPTDKPRDMWEILRNRKETEWNELKKQEAALTQFTAESQQLSLDYQKEALDELGKQGQSVAWNVFKGEIGQVLGKWTGSNLKKVLEQDGVEKDAVAVVNELHSLKAMLLHIAETVVARPLLFVGWLLASAICIALPFLLAPLLPYMNSIVARLAVWIPPLLSVLRVLNGWVKQVDGSLQAYRNRTEQEQRRLQGLAQEWVQKKQAAEEERVRALVNDGSRSPAAIEEELTWMATGVRPEERDAQGNVTRVRQVMPKNLSAYQALVKIQQAKVEQQRRRVGMVGRFTTLAEFVQTRLESGFYENQLGPMRQVELDIAELSDGLALHQDNLTAEEIKVRGEGLRALFPKGPARVVLFIDDLDRCPPPRVVEVLEATQLLLKTPLFIVVLGLDTRYATRALEKEYSAILQHDGDPSGLDYIEKIIQIPYRVRPIEPAGLGSFLRDQMNPLDVVTDEEAEPSPGQDRGAATVPVPSTTPDGAKETTPSQANLPGAQIEPVNPPAVEKPPVETPAEVPKAVIETRKEGFVELPPAIVRFTYEDFEDVQACCQLVRLTPRSVKRLVNVMKLMEVFWFRTLLYDRERPVKQSVIALLAMAAAYPEVMVEVFTQMDTYFGGLPSPEPALGDYLIKLERDSLRLAGPGRDVLLWQFDRLIENVHAFRTVRLESGAVADFLGVNFAHLTRETFNLVRSFSFIGDPAYTLEDAARDEQSKQSAK